MVEIKPIVYNVASYIKDTKAMGKVQETNEKYEEQSISL
jgi:hypothetical protein